VSNRPQILAADVATCVALFIFGTLFEKPQLN